MLYQSLIGFWVSHLQYKKNTERRTSLLTLAHISACWLVMYAAECIHNSSAPTGWHFKTEQTRHESHCFISRLKQEHMIVLDAIRPALSIVLCWSQQNDFDWLKKTTCNRSKQEDPEGLKAEIWILYFVKGWIIQRALFRKTYYYLSCEAFIEAGLLFWANTFLVVWYRSNSCECSIVIYIT